ncbi:MAG: putative holin [Solidesulfovibrio sp. DCME]|uniref:putative holin n=1 Tax=Solidesulfovibrio sp. DCME TaxID=3447380 RepID=UPI003D0D7C35
MAENPETKAAAPDTMADFREMLAGLIDEKIQAAAAPASPLPAPAAAKAPLFARLTPRMLACLFLACLSVAGVTVLSPAQLPVAAYKLALVSVAGYLGYWLDRWCFPYARPDSFLAAADWRAEKKPLSDSEIRAIEANRWQLLARRRLFLSGSPGVMAPSAAFSATFPVPAVPVAERGVSRLVACRCGVWTGRLLAARCALPVERLFSCRSAVPGWITRPVACRSAVPAAVARLVPCRCDVLDHTPVERLLACRCAVPAADAAVVRETYPASPGMPAALPSPCRTVWRWSRARPGWSTAMRPGRRPGMAWTPRPSGGATPC